MCPEKIILSPFKVILAIITDSEVKSEGFLLHSARRRHRVRRLRGKN